MGRDFEGQFQREGLHMAAGRGDLGEVEVLLGRGYPVNRFDELGKTPLHYAVAGEHLEIVDRLIEMGARVDAHDERRVGNTALGDNIETCSHEMAKRLIEAGADPMIKGWMGLTAMDRVGRRKDADARKIRNLLKGACRVKEG